MKTSKPLALVLCLMASSVSWANPASPSPNKVPVNETLGPGLDESTASTVKKVVKAKRSQVVDCYNKSLADDPNLSGKAVVTFNIKDEQTQAVKVTAMTPALQSCINSKVNKWVFKGVKDAPGVELSYHLQPSN